jgi:hypothetical protein
VTKFRQLKNFELLFDVFDLEDLLRCHRDPQDVEVLAEAEVEAAVELASV